MTAPRDPQKSRLLSLAFPGIVPSFYSIANPIADITFNIKDEISTRIITRMPQSEFLGIP